MYEPIRVLHVDANLDSATPSAAPLERGDDRLRVETATGASEGLALLAEQEFDCVVTGYDLPNRNGIEFLEGIREHDPDLPVILCTGAGDEQVASEAISAGVTDYLRKDADVDVGELLTDRILDAVADYRAERRPPETERLLLELTDATDDVLWMFTHDWSEALFVNSTYEDVWGQSVDALDESPRGFLNSVHPDDREQVLEAMERLSDGESADLEYRVNPDEEYQRWVWVRGKPIRDEAGNVTRIAGFARDVTDRKTYELAIAELHDTVRASMEARSPEEIARIVVVAVRDILGMPLNAVWFHDEQADVLEPVEWTERSTTVVSEPPVFPAGEGLAWDVLESGESRHYDDVSTVSGRHNPDTPMRSEILLPVGDHGVIIIGSTEAGAFDDVDVSLAETVAAHAETALDRIAREEQLREEREFVEQAINTLSDVFYVVGADGRLRRWNDRLPEVTGYPPEKFEEMPATALFPEAGRERVAAAIEEVLTTGHATVEAEVLTADDERIPYQLTGTRLTDTEGTVTGIVGVGRDVTEQKAYERELKRQNERLEEFASIVSHDLRNPLNVAQGRLELVQQQVDHDQLDVVADAHRRIQRLIDDLLAVAREGEGAIELSPVDLGGLTRECWRNVDTGGATVALEDDRRIMADDGKLKQLLENLFRNAVEHAGADVTVSVGVMADGFYVEDDGPGIPSAEAGAVFESGYSTSDDGAGLGLLIVEQVAAAHGWSVAVTEGSDGGARFEVTGVEFVD